MLELVVNPKLSKYQVARFYKNLEQPLTEHELTRITKVLRKSYVIAAYEQHELVGWICALSDYMTIVYIQDILITPAYRSKRIAWTLMRHLMDYFAHVPRIDAILKDNQVSELYTSLGFYPLEDKSQKLYCFEHYQK